MMGLYADMEIDASHAAAEPAPPPSWTAFLDIETATLPLVLAERAAAEGVGAGDLPAWLVKHAA